MLFAKYTNTATYIIVNTVTYTYMIPKSNED
jgi:hypothetical protein